MTPRNRQRGSGRLGFLVALALVGAVGFAAYRIIPVRIQAYEFRDVLREEARYAAVRNSDDEVTRRILAKAADLEIPLKRQNLQVRRSRGQMVVSASYERPIDLKVTTYVYRFRAEERAPLF